MTDKRWEDMTEKERGDYVRLLEKKLTTLAIGLDSTNSRVSAIEHRLDPPETQMRTTYKSA